MILVKILTSRCLHLDIPMKLIVLAYTQHPHLEEFSFSSQFCYFPVIYSKRWYNKCVYFKSNSFGVVWKCVHATCFNMPIFFTYYIFKVLTTALFLLDYADSMKTVINLLGSTTLPKSYFRFWMRNYKVTMFPEWYPMTL